MTLLTASVYQRGDLWFWRCGECHRFEGAFTTERFATLALMNHRTKAHP